MRREADLSYSGEMLPSNEDAAFSSTGRPPLLLYFALLGMRVCQRQLNPAVLGKDKNPD